MSEAKWFLRTQDETFGPETQERLVEWARMGRVQPGQEISDDEIVWQPVEQVAFLDMRFSIDIGDGNPRGPFNRAAAEALLASGRLPPTASLVEVREPFEPESLPAEGAASFSETPVVADEPQIVEKVIEKIVEVPVEKVVRVEVPVEREVRVEVPVEKIVEKVIVDETRVRELEGLLEEERRHAAEVKARLEESMQAMRQAKEDHAALLAERDAACSEAVSRAKNLDEQVATLTARVTELEGILGEERRHTCDLQTRLDESMKTASLQKAQLAESDAAATESNARAAKLSEQVIALENELKRLPTAASEVADMQAAVFKILQDEAAVVSETLAREKAEFEACRTRYQARVEKLSEARVAILKMSGRDVEEMTRKALAGRPEDPRTTRIRKEYDELRRLYENARRESEAQIRKLTDDLRQSRAEGMRMGENLRDVAQLRGETEQLREALKRTQKDLLEERQRSEELLQREALGRQALLARLSSLESPSIGTAVSMETNQSREAKQVKLPSWMRLNKA